jgi:molybdopterin-guanine dinucleotide biosynthesis protein A
LNISGVILAGGANKRFNGVTKAMVVIDGKTIISRAIDTIKDLFNEIIIVTNTPEEFKEFKNCKLVSDHFLRAGPLGGIHAALTAASGEAVFVFAGDMPLLNKDLILRQIAYFKNCKSDVLVPRINQNIEPLHAIYGVGIRIFLEDYLTKENDYAVRKFLKLVNVGFLQLEDSEVNKSAFTNINTPSDILRVRTILGIM